MQFSPFLFARIRYHAMPAVIAANTKITITFSITESCPKFILRLSAHIPFLVGVGNQTDDHANHSRYGGKATDGSADIQ